MYTHTIYIYIHTLYIYIYICLVCAVSYSNTWTARARALERAGERGCVGGKGGCMSCGVSVICW